MIKTKKEKFLALLTALLVVAPVLTLQAQAKERPLLNLIKTKIEERQAEQGTTTPRGLEGVLEKTITKLQAMETKVTAVKLTIKTKIEQWRNREE